MGVKYISPFIYTWARTRGGVADTVARDTSTSRTDTLRLAAVTAADTGSYQCVVRGVLAQTASRAGRLVLEGAAALASREGLPDATIRARGSSLIFRLPAEAASARFSILNPSGRALESRMIGNGQREAAWDGSGVSQGIYIVRLLAWDADRRPVGKIEKRMLLAP